MSIEVHYITPSTLSPEERVRLEEELQKRAEADKGITTRAVKRPFDRVRRITGYLVGTVERFNNAKRAEEHDRVKHSLR